MPLRLPRLAFRQLRTRLAVLYAGLFAVAMFCISAALDIAVEHNARGQVMSELVASGTVFDRLWGQRTAQLRDAAGLLARDYGFRAAVATHDARTIESALANLRGRLGLRMAFIVGTDGAVTGLGDATLAKEAGALSGQLDNGIASGAVSLGGVPRHIVAAPIMAPALEGWVIFSTDLDAREMHALERLSAIPLTAGVYQRRGDGGWADSAGRADPATSAFIAHTLHAAAPSELSADGGAAIGLAKPLPTMAGEPATVLLLRYPVARALAGYRPLEVAIALFGLLGLALVMLATWRMAQSITRPISLLDDAAERLARGDAAEVAIETEDELGRLAASFNRMAGEIAERERRIAHLAFNDVLTALPNRALFHEQLDRELKLAERRGGGVALFCLDLDQFKTINDTLGHPIGDGLLQLVATRLTEQLGDIFVARLGGDEFVVIQPLDNVAAQVEEIEALGRRMLALIAAPGRVAGHDVEARASIGIAVSPSDGLDTSTLLRAADLALHQAKDGGRNAFCFFEPALNARAQARRSIERDLRQALTRGELRLHYQPLYDLKQDRIGGFEALLRWQHPTRGLVPPIEFIPIAEETGLIVPIGAWAMQEACRQAVAWPDHVRIAVNVSTVQIRRPGLAQTILQALQFSGLRPGRLEVEITESIFLDHDGPTLELLHSLRALGIRIALDDFGTGYSSLSYLQSFPFDKIKIDRAFIIDLLTRPGAGAIVKAITDLASALGMETTAEGVEEIGQLSALRVHGCSSVQGYLFSKPVPAEQVAALLARPPIGSLAA